MLTGLRIALHWLQCEKLRAESSMLPGIRAELEALRRRHSAALELMGERDEEVHIFSLVLLFRMVNKFSALDGVGWRGMYNVDLMLVLFCY
jgi:hypothetical protein